LKKTNKELTLVGKTTTANKHTTEVKAIAEGKKVLPFHHGWQGQRLEQLLYEQS
jgi:hypothetical protein